jgi:hypothetical protein
LVFLAVMSGLIARLSTLVMLATLLSVLFHIVCHEVVLLLAVRGCAQCDFDQLAGLRCWRTRGGWGERLYLPDRDTDYNSRNENNKGQQRLLASGKRRGDHF